MKQLLLQAFNLIRQNPSFYATISIIGTAVTIIAFVMVVVMIYDIYIG